MASAINQHRRRFLEVAAMAALGTQLGAVGYAKARLSAGIGLLEEDTFPPLSGATEWLNSHPLTAAGLRGKVVLIQFWTYTCVNWRRTLPYVRGWAEKYRSRGLVVIGVHTPEFSFEHDTDNVRWAIKDMKIDYPIANDNEYAIWNAFKNEYWPANYFIDAKGKVRHHQFGEGAYEQSETLIQQLLSETGGSAIDPGLVTVAPSGAEVAADWGNLQSPETYVGQNQTDNFASPGVAYLNSPHVYTFPRRLDLNHWALSGNWTTGKEAATSNQSGGRVAYRFHARDLNLVMGPAVRGGLVRFRVLIDGEPPVASCGVDIDSEGNGKIVEQRLYQLIRQPTPIVDRQCEIEFLNSGAEAYDFTFG
jgi:thiol-disulfide isomerase/thioredoxin